MSQTARELRDYRIAEGSLDDFVAEWRSGIVPLRRELGFTIERVWTVRDESRFVWLLAYPGDWSEFEAANERYYASPARAALDPDPARLIEEQKVSRLTEVDLPAGE